MAELALNNSLIDEYIKYKFEENYSSEKIIKLFKFIQPFSIRSNHSDFFENPLISKQFIDPLASIIDPCSDDELVKNTVLKLMLTDNYSIESYKTLNINNSLEKLKLKYGATYPNSIDKEKAQKHIKALLSDAKYIKIIDGYVSTPRMWNDNKTLIANIVPNINIDLVVIGADKDAKIKVISKSQKYELQKLIPNLKEVKAIELTPNIHDRYIETDKLKILLSSGMEHLSSDSSKDFTYIIEIK